MVESLLPCPFCGAHLERSEQFSNRSAEVFMHPDNECVLGLMMRIIVPTQGYRSDREGELARISAWNRRAVSVEEVLNSMSEFNPRPHAGVVFPDEWNQDEGTPDIASVANAIQVWAMFNPPYRHSVRHVGEVFNLDDAQVRQAVEAHYWMYLDGPADDPHQQFIEHDGE